MRRRTSGLATLPHFFKRRAARRMFVAADLARDSKAWGAAEAHYDKLCREFPLAAALHVQRGNMLKEGGRYTEARQAYAIACWLDPADADVWLQLGHLSKLENRLGDAVAAYRRSHELDPQRPDAAVELARLAEDDDGSAVAGTAVPSRRLPLARFSSASDSMLTFGRLRVSLVHQPRSR